ncbi:MAG TPA: sigma 54-interacting transcriptional regulator [Thermoanaerobaculia bacterium]|nr:sigma 54-interacting transcriptional regulator [Thermoanaerobaculia bacterium]
MSPLPGPPTLDQLFRRFPGLARALDGLAAAARSEAPLLLLGEGGCGRSTLARAVHASSPRAAAPLVEVDPATIPAGLFESNLFGHRAGAFTGADVAAEGRVARADGGTLVLDHVEEIPVAAQPKLLRLLAEKRYRPLGGEERPADVRFVTLAGEQLPERVRQGAFRGDLYYRLEVLAFRVPPLRERLDDLPALLDELLAELAERLGRPPCRLSPRALEWIRRHPWPGNLRELRNLLEREVILARGEVLDPAPTATGTDARPRPLAEIEREEIRKALAFTRGHQGRAAELLGISRKALWEKRKRMGIP